MDNRGIDAYDIPERVAVYDDNMAVMHPNRPQMVRIALDFLPCPKETPLRALDLGIGTGFFTAEFLRCFPNSTVVGVDGAAAMAELAQVRLGLLASRVDFRIGDFRRLNELSIPSGTFDIVYSSYALHHLNSAEKRSAVAQAVELLRPGGWFFNADLIVADASEMEERIQQLRIEGILERAKPGDERFRDAATARRFLDELEREDGDQPQTVAEDLRIFREAGVCDVSILWLEHREVVLVGRRSSL
jgi:SAM-dependent methyltransferase